MRIAGKAGSGLRLAIILALALSTLSLFGGASLADGGTSWSAQASGTTNGLYGVSALDATHVWTVGVGGTILFFDGTSWAAQASTTTNDLRAVSALDATHVWAVGDAGTILFYDGTSWSVQASGITNTSLKRIRPGRHPRLGGGE